MLPATRLQTPVFSKMFIFVFLFLLTTWQTQKIQEVFYSGVSCVRTELRNEISRYS